MKYLYWLISGLCLIPMPAFGQVAADDSLSTKVTTSDRRNFTVEAGDRAGNNLFHSFESFSVPTNGSVLFNNAVDIENIFSRVTGGSISQIDGIIRSLGEANLFLLNPNGIIFGNNAALDIGGSFIGSTGEAIQFADGTEFSAIAANNKPLLTVSIPIGLQYGLNPGEIEVQGVGNNLSFEPYSELSRGLEVQSGRTLALVGGKVELTGGNLTAPEGNIEIGGVGSESFVDLTPTATGFKFNYDQVNNFEDIDLFRQASINSSGSKNGRIHLQGGRIYLTEGSSIVGANSSASAGEEVSLTSRQLIVDEQARIVTIANGTGTAGKIDIKASELVELTDRGFDNLERIIIELYDRQLKPQDLGTNISSLTQSTGKAGDIAIDTSLLKIKQGSVISSFTTTLGTPGNIDINASEKIIVSGSALSSLNASVDDKTNGGSVFLNTSSLEVLNGSTVNAVTFGSGKGGEIIIKADYIKLADARTVFPDLLGASLTNISASTLGSGDAGNLTIDTGSLTVQDGAVVTSNSLTDVFSATGSSGNITITASEVIELSGSSANDLFQSALSTSTLSNSPAGNIDVVTEKLIIRDRASIESDAINLGDAGNIKITASELNLQNNGLISVQTLGLGDAGTLEINADLLNLKQQSAVSAKTKAGKGGNIRLESKNITLFDNSQVSTDAENSNGGNIKIDTNTLIAIENSDITANAFQGRGGRVVINARGIFGIESREQNTPASDITATSELGSKFNGLVQINELVVNPSQGLAELSTKVIDRDRLIILSCAIDTDNSFLVTGRGGLPADAEKMLSGEVGWQDWRIPTLVKNTAKSLNFTRDRGEITGSPNGEFISPFRTTKTNIVEARRWKINQRGKIVLTVETNEGFDGTEFWSKSPQCRAAKSFPSSSVREGES